MKLFYRFVSDIDASVKQLPKVNANDLKAHEEWINTLCNYTMRMFTLTKTCKHME